MSERTLPEDVKRRRKTWWIGAHVNRAVWGLLVLSGIIAGVVLSTFQRPDSRTVKILGLITALSAALIAHFDPRGHADKFLRAWRLLDKACRAYQHGTDPTVKELDDAVDAGESIIGVSSEERPITPRATHAPDTAGTPRRTSQQRTPDSPEG